MALNLIKVPGPHGPLWIGVRHITAVLPGTNPNNCNMMVTGFPDVISIALSANTVAELANRRPPDGS